MKIGKRIAAHAGRVQFRYSLLSYLGIAPRGYLKAMEIDIARVVKSLRFRLMDAVYRWVTTL